MSGLKITRREPSAVAEMSIKELIDAASDGQLLELVNQLTGGSADRKVVQHYIDTIRRDGVWLNFYPENKFRLVDE